MIRGESRLKMVLLIVDMTFKTNLKLRRGLPISFFLISPRIVMIEVLILNLKKREKLIHQKIDKLVVSVVRNMWVNVLLRLIVSIFVARVAIW